MPWSPCQYHFNKRLGPWPPKLISQTCRTAQPFDGVSHLMFAQRYSPLSLKPILDGHLRVPRLRGESATTPSLEAAYTGRRSKNERTRKCLCAIASSSLPTSILKPLWFPSFFFFESCLFWVFFCFGVVLALRYDTPSVVWIRCLFEKSLGYKERSFSRLAKVPLRHRLGRRVAAETGPATMPSALSSGSSSRGRSHTFPSRNPFMLDLSRLPHVDSRKKTNRRLRTAYRPRYA
ncbi:hypothetical protein GGR55DRAFT_606343 [Xylaria sp. FL0064]|nr:hypothetical protein GGR55DRAFT_606343 [Xylaria sp. FL0064]